MLLNCLHNQPTKRIDFGTICSFFTSKITRITSSELFDLKNSHSPSSSPKIPHSPSPQTTITTTTTTTNDEKKEHDYDNINPPNKKREEEEENDEIFSSLPTQE